MLEDGEIAHLNGPLGEDIFSDFFNQAFSLLALAGSVSELRDTGLDYLGEVKRTLISAATKEAVCDAHFSQLSNMALFIIQ